MYINTELVVFCMDFFLLYFRILIEKVPTWSNHGVEPKKNKLTPMSSSRMPHLHLRGPFRGPIRVKM